jgi:hypothetical protein
LGLLHARILRPRLSGSRQTTRKYPRPAKVDSVASEHEPQALKAGALFVGGSSARRLPHTHPLPRERSESPSSLYASCGRTDTAEDRTVPGTMMARLEVDGQAGTGQVASVSRGRERRASACFSTGSSPPAPSPLASPPRRDGPDIAGRFTAALLSGSDAIHSESGQGFTSKTIPTSLEPSLVDSRWIAQPTDILGKRTATPGRPETWPS